MNLDGIRATARTLLDVVPRRRVDYIGESA